ncbi:MAG: methyl-accepting chemotaxis protein [Telluria sp.]
MLNRLSVRNRLGLGFGLVLFALGITSAISLIRLSAFNDEITDMADDKVTKVILANDWLFSVMESARHTRNVLILDEREKVLGELENLKKQKKARAGFLDDLKRIATAPQERARLQEVIDARAAYMPNEDELIKVVADGDMVAAKKTLLEKARPTQLVYISKLRDFVQMEKGLVAQAKEKTDAGYSATHKLILIVSIAGFISGVIASVVIARSLIKQLGGEPAYAADIANRIAAGDLGVAIATNHDDQSSLLFAIKGMRDELVKIVSQVRNGADTIVTASAEIASGNQDLSSRTEEQASSLEETASTMEELASTVKQNADNAKEADRLAAAASSIAAAGGDVVSQVVTTMDGINASARKIVEIISVIDGISFQTNILALNAAVEAARAGEQGRGFAVVATEVRNLAQRSASAAKEIKTLIGDSVDRVEEGNHLVAKAGSTMGDVVDSVKKVSAIVAGIASASQEQSSGIDQVNLSIAQMERVTQQNAALVEEAAAASEAMEQQAAKLAEAVSVFKLESAARTATSAARLSSARHNNVGALALQA